MILRMALAWNCVIKTTVFKIVLLWNIGMLGSVSLKDKVTLGAALAMMLLLLVIEHSSLNVNSYIQLVLCLLAYVPISYATIKQAFITLFKRLRLNEQFLMMVATFGAFALEDYPEALAVMIFYQIGEIFERYAAGKAHSEIKALVKLKPTVVRVIEQDGSEQLLKPRRVKIGQRIRVLPGEAVAMDGTLLNDCASIDTSALTGESAPVLYRKGEEILSGCINTSSMIELAVSRDFRNSSIVRLLNLIEDAATSKSRPEALISRFAVWYTPIVVTIAVLLSCVPFFIADARFQDWFTRSLVFLIVSCPCALILSVPLSFFGGLGAISKTGVIVKGSIHIENMAKLKMLAFDKTGTVTKGKFVLSDIRTENCSEQELLETLYALEQHSTHPLARGVVAYAQEHAVNLHEVHKLEEKTGFGLQAELDGIPVAAGRFEFISKLINSKDSAARIKNSDTSIYVAKSGVLLGSVSLYDEPKAEAYSTFAKLKEMHIETCLITGDKHETAQKVADELDISSVMAEQLPESKLSNFERLKSSYRIVGFVGDGINDAPVLAASDVGIAMGQFGSAAAVEASDVVVMNDDLTKIPTAMKLARKTYLLALENLWLSLGIKFLILLLGALGFANIWLAIFGDVGVLVLAVLNAMRSLGFVKKRDYLELKTLQETV